MFPGQNRRVNDFPAREKVDALSQRPWTPPELPISSSFLPLYSNSMEPFPNSYHSTPAVRGSVEAWYPQRPTLQQTPMGAQREQLGHLRMPMAARPRIPSEFLVDPYRSGPRRPMPYSGLESIHLTNTVPPFRTVPTSITITPSKQQKNPTNTPIPKTENSLIPPGPQTLPPSNPEVPVIIRDRPLPPQPTPAQRYCALFFAHCRHCRNPNCFFGGLCHRVKKTISHIWQCSSTAANNNSNHCHNEACYPTKSVFHHFRNCQDSQCLFCAQIRSMIKEIKQKELRFDPPPPPSGGQGLSPPPPPTGGIQQQKPEPLLSPLENSLMSQSVVNEALDSSMTPMVVPNPSFNSPIFNKGLSDGDLESTSNPNPEPGSTGSVTSSTSFQLGTSLFEAFTPEEIGDYLQAIRGPEGLPLIKPEPFLKDKLCAVCLKGEQTLQPIQLFCDCCFTRIKRSSMYWKPKPEAKIYVCICHKCFSSQKSDSEFHIGTYTVSKDAFRWCKNDECVTETWVACDKCGYWVHSSCGMFNRGENNEKTKYMCPFCLKEELECGFRKSPIQRPTSMWDASQLPQTSVSTFIETKIHSKITPYLTGDSGVVVRVLMSMKKVTRVQPMMAKAFPEHPKEYPYRQRVIGVFQKIHGCDVLLFCMCVQEYGEDCPKPNKQWVNLEYIDSVKHFTPESKTPWGQSLRTLLYQETLLAYIEFVKLRGFEVFYIWACPPSKEGDDYILHCKPPNQRVPSTERLRSWYKSLLKLGKDRDIIKQDSNLLDSFFTQGVDRFGSTSFNPTALPYFEGDYWPTEAEKLLKSFQETKNHDLKKKSLGKRKTRGEASINEYLETGLMSNLKYPRWSDFMVWHLQEPCSFCHKHVRSGSKFTFKNSGGGGSLLGIVQEPVRKKAHFEGIKLGGREGPMNPSHFFQLCESCFQICQELGGGVGGSDGINETIPDFVNLEDLIKEEITSTSIDSNPEEEEEEIFSEIFESRQSFLAFCKANHYQFDTLQHAKHTTMMLLYHLHNTEAPVFPVICNSCGLELPKNEAKNLQSSEVAICGLCKTNGKINNRPSSAAAAAAAAMGQQEPMRNAHSRPPTMTDPGRYFEAFQHAARCTTPYCTYPLCTKFKELFRHVVNCKVRRLKEFAI